MLSTVDYSEKQEKGWVLLLVTKVRESGDDDSGKQSMVEAWGKNLT